MSAIFSNFSKASDINSPWCCFEHGERRIREGWVGGKWRVCSKMSKVSFLNKIILPSLWPCWWDLGRTSSPTLLFDPKNISIFKHLVQIKKILTIFSPQKNTRPNFLHFHQNLKKELQKIHVGNFANQHKVEIAPNFVFTIQTCAEVSELGGSSPC